MLDDAFQRGTLDAINDLAQRPRPPRPQAPTFSVWGLVKAPGQGILGGAAEGLGSVADITGALGTINLATNVPEDATILGGIGGRAPIEERERAQQRVIDGEAFQTEVGRSLRTVSKDYMPDPVTTHGASMAVADFFRVGTKAGAAMVTVGPLAGALLAGAEEGFSEADKLAQEGVDGATRARVGLVTGAVTAAGFALPVAGKTVKGTVGLAVAGGPASFVAQQAATREILDSAGYEELANRYDPFDPVGLTLSTLVPLGFGAAAMRRAKTRKPGDPLPPDPDTVDAARVDLLNQKAEASRLAPDGDIPGAVSHRSAISKAIDQLSNGQRVDVVDMIPAEFAGRAVREIDAALSRVAEDVWFSSSTVSDLSTLDPKFSKEGNLYGPAVYLAKSQEFSETYARGGVDPKTGEARPQGQTYQAEFRPENPLDADKVYSKSEAERILSAAGIDAKKVRDLLANKAKASGETIYKALSTGLGNKALANEALLRQGYDAILFKSKGEQLAASLRPVDVEPAPPRQPQPKTEAQDPAKVAAKQPAQELALEPMDRPGEAVKPESPEVEAAARELETSMPDLMVRLDGMDEAAPLSELMVRVRREVAEDLEEVPLIEVAASCFLRNS